MKSKMPIQICFDKSAGIHELLAAKELRRYLYLRTSELFEIKAVSSLPAGGNLIVVTTKGNEILKCIEFDGKEPEPQGYLIKDFDNNGRKIVVICGGDSIGALYGVYHFAETLGVRFHMHGDTIPDEQIEFSLPNIDEVAKPLFELRGILPFHDFAEGPDWWNADDYKAYISQMVKMRMNFIGLHCYPNVPWGPEPTVWMGLPEDVNDDGTVNFSYPASFHTTERLNAYGENSGSKKRWWGYSSTATRQFSAGANLIFEYDNYGPDCMGGYLYHDLTPETSNEVFNLTGKMFNDVFGYARELGVKTALGTETPLILPDELKEHLVDKGMNPEDPKTIKKIYDGMVKHISRAFPLDYYWAWTPEGWLSPRPQIEIDHVAAEFDMACKAIDEAGNPFTFATCGWVMGPVQNPMLFDQILEKKSPISCITSWLGASRLNSNFGEIKERPKWAIPWLEDDTAMVSPQLWVGRMRRDASDAYESGCTGLMGIHWRTKILSPNFDTLAKAGWNQKWNINKEDVKKTIINEVKEGYDAGQTANYAEKEIADTDQDTIYQSCRFGLNSYRLIIPNGKYDLTLKFCEIHYKEPDKRVFDVKVMGNKVAENLDVFAKAGALKPYDIIVENVKVTQGLLDIDFDIKVEFPFIAAIVIDGYTDDLNQIKGKPFTRKINCGGPKFNDYEADLDRLKQRIASRPGPRDLPCEDFYLNWCQGEFGPEAKQELAELFICLDSGGPLDVYSFEGAWPRRMPLPSVWIDGPGGIRVNNSPWDQIKQKYVFIDKMTALRPVIKGKGNLSRFDYWLNSFRYLKTMDQLSCVRGQLDNIMQTVAKENDFDKQKIMAKDSALPLRIKLARLWEVMITYQLAATDTPGELGTIANLEQHSRRNLNYLDIHDVALKDLLGGQLPQATNVSTQFKGEPRIIVPCLRSQLKENENFKLKIFILDNKKAKSAKLYWRKLGEKKWQLVDLQYITRAVYMVQLEPQKDDFEYFIQAETSKGQQLVFPATAPQINQTVVIMP
ncbi:MAG: hypothetical protein JEZ07_16425 [Phycisphaerae bacterium]|nr:hypothetical protein [Phycisphaerae bacterium]